MNCKNLFLSLLFVVACSAHASTKTAAGCTQAGIESARDAAGIGGVVIIPNCTYTVDGLQATVAGQTWVMMGDAKLQRSATSPAPVLKLLADLKLRGGVLDGARGVNTTIQVGVDGTGYAFDWQAGTMQNVPGWGVALDNSDMLLRDLKFKGIYNACIIWRNTATVTRNGPLIENVLCDRADESPSGIQSGGILIHASAGKWTINPRVINFDVRLPQSDAYANVGVEIINSQHARILNGKTLGGRIGLSFGNAAFGIIANNIIQVPIDYAVELATGSFNVNVQANNATGFGPSRWGIIASSASTGLRAIGNSLYGFTGSCPGVGNSSVCAYLDGSSYAVNYGN